MDRDPHVPFSLPEYDRASAQAAKRMWGVVESDAVPPGQALIYTRPPYISEFGSQGEYVKAYERWKRTGVAKIEGIGG